MLSRGSWLLRESPTMARPVFGFPLGIDRHTPGVGAALLLGVRERTMMSVSRCLDALTQTNPSKAAIPGRPATFGHRASARRLSAQPHQIRPDCPSTAANRERRSYFRCSRWRTLVPHRPQTRRAVPRVVRPVRTSYSERDSETERVARQSSAHCTRNYQSSPRRVAASNKKALLQIGRGLSAGRAERI